MLCSNWTFSNGSENNIVCLSIINPFSPHDALKHHFTSLKTDLIFLQQRVLERKFPWNWFTNAWQFSFNFHTTSNHLHLLQVENCDSNSRLVVDEDDNGKFRPERVKDSLLHFNHSTIFCSSRFIFSITKHKTLNQNWLIVGLASKTVGQR